MGIWFMAMACFLELLEETLEVRAYLISLPNERLETPEDVGR